MAPPGTNKILTHVGVITGGRLSDAAFDAFVARVIALLMSGNQDGKGLLLAKALSVPLPPFAGPEFPSPSLTNLSSKEHLFWFGPDPTAALSIPYLKDRSGPWAKTFVDGFYAELMKAFDLPGTYVPPLFDPTIYGIDFTFNLPDLPKLPIDLPKLLLPEIPKLTAKLGIPSLELPPFPPAIPPTIKMPPIPKISTELPMPSFVLPDFFAKIILKILAKLPDILIPKLPTAIIDLFPLKLLFEIFFEVLIELKIALVLPKLLVATMIVMMHNVAIALACDLVGLILGSGSIVKAVAVFGGLTSIT